MKFKRFVLAVCSLALLGAGSMAVAADAPSAGGKPPPKDIVLKGDAKCTSCHDEADAPELLRIGKTRHGTVADKRTPTCTSCHGESEKHAGHKGSDKPPKPDRSFKKGPAMSSAEVRSQTCTSCHDSGNHLFWTNSTHAARGVACNDCHQVHTAQDKARDKKVQSQVCYTCHKEQRAQMSKPSRHPVPEGKMGCSDCHNPHGSPGQKQLVRGSVNETCYTCHMEKRGPFINNHQPVSEDCSICHNPHGSNVANLLKSRPPFLCQECHEGAQHPSTSAPAGLPVATAGGLSPGGRGQMASVGRGCVNCHTNIHGSNNPINNGTSGDRLTR